MKIKIYGRISDKVPESKRNSVNSAEFLFFICIYQFIDQFLQTSGEEYVVKGQKHVVKTSEKILAAMRANPEVTAEMLAVDLELSKRGIEDSIARLRKSGRVIRHGGRKDGYWEVVELV